MWPEHRIITDVSREATLAVIAEEQRPSVLLTVNEENGRGKDPAFTEHFFAVSRGSNGSGRDLGDQLLGLRR